MSTGCIITLRSHANLRRPLLGLEWALRTTTSLSTPAERSASSKASWLSTDAARRGFTSRLLDVAASQVGDAPGDVISARCIIMCTLYRVRQKVYHCFCSFLSNRLEFNGEILNIYLIIPYAHNSLISV